MGRSRGLFAMKRRLTVQAPFLVLRLENGRWFCGLKMGGVATISSCLESVLIQNPPQRLMIFCREAALEETCRKGII